MNTSSVTAAEDLAMEMMGNSSEQHGEDGLMEVALSIGLGIIDTIGIIGNILSLIALFNIRTTAMYCILRAIALADTVMLLCHLTFQVLPNINVRIGVKFDWIIIYIGNAYFGNTARLISTWLTVLVSVERWFAISRPLHLNIFTQRRTVRRIILVWILVPIYWFPNVIIDLLLPTDHQPEKHLHTSMINETSSQQSSPASSKSLQYVQTFLHIGAFAPAMLIITACNVNIMRVLNSTRNRWALITANQRQEYKSTRIPIMIVVIFYISETPSLVCYILGQFEIVDVNVDSVTWTVLAVVCNYLIVINASINIVIYFLFARQGLLIICYASVTSQSSMFVSQAQKRKSFIRSDETIALDSACRYSALNSSRRSCKA